MDSLMFYEAACSRYAGRKNGNAREKVVDFEKLISLILKELDSEPYDISTSPFLAEADKVYGKARKGGKAAAGQLRRKRPNLFDTCEAAVSVFLYLRGEQDPVSEEGRLGERKHLLFTGSFSEAGLERRLGSLQKNIEGIKNCLKEKNITKEAERAVSGVEIMESAQPDDDPSCVQLRAEQECTKRTRMRLEANERAVGQWRGSQAELIKTMTALQMDLSRELKQLMNYSDNITENYVLRFARSMTEIYNLIADGYQFHRERARSAQNEDYYNAVLNYEEFMSSISDALAVFGVEEITSSGGTAFDGKIHEAADGFRDFSAHTAVVKKSVRPGFRYNDIVIQKERIQL